MSRRLALAGAALVALAAGCGGGGGESPEQALSKTATSLGRIRSGTLHLELVLTPHGKSARGPIGFRLDGPFALRGSGTLPVARVAYTQLANGKRATVTIVSTGRRAYVQTRGRTYELGAEREAALRQAAGQVRTSGGTARVAIDHWLRDPKLSDGGEVGGAETDRIRAALNVVRAANDLLALARLAGSDAEPLRGRSAGRLARAVRSASFDVWTGKKDRLLRRARIDLDFALDVPRELRTALGSLVGSRFRFVLAVDALNRPVRVQAPAHALPASQLPGG